MTCSSPSQMVHTTPVLSVTPCVRRTLRFIQHHSLYFSALYYSFAGIYHINVTTPSRFCY